MTLMTFFLGEENDCTLKARCIDLTKKKTKNIFLRLHGNVDVVSH